MKLAIIPARGGSKRIPNKNIKLFFGKPIIAYSIETALKSGLFDKVIVSTDDKSIADIALNSGAEVPFLRPSEISNDYAVIADVIKHALKWYSEKGEKVEYVCCIYATAPLLEVADLTAGFNMVVSGSADMCLSITSFSFPIQRALKCDQNGSISAFYPEFISMRSQDLEASYHDAAQFFCGTHAAFMDTNKPVITKGYMVARSNVQDIDTLEDWQVAELLYQAKTLKNKI
jgi:N-acylneuraminate cytidylyltransferase